MESAEKFVIQMVVFHRLPQDSRFGAVLKTVSLSLLQNRRECETY